MKRLLAILTTVTLLMSIMLPLSVSAKTTAEKEIVAGETMTIKVGDLFSRWRTESYGMDGNVTRNGAAYTAYTGSQNSATNGSVEENYATVTFPEDGLYTFTFVANKKSGTCANIDLLLDGNVIGTIGKDGEEGAGENIADQFNLNETNPTWYGVNGYASPREYKVTTEVLAGTHTVGYGVTPPADGRMILFIGNIDIVGPVEADYPDVSVTGKTVIEAESIVDTTYGDGTSTWANLQNKIMFYEGAAASGNFFVGANGDGAYNWGEPDDSHFKLRTKREFLEDGWYDFSYVVSSKKVGEYVSTVDIVLHPLDGGDDIVVGSNAYPADGEGDGENVENVTFKDKGYAVTFINNNCGIFKYNSTVYVPAGNYEVEILPTVTADNKYKFYADYVAIEPGEEPTVDYPNISETKETRIEAEDIVETQYGDGTSTWANLQNKVMFYEGEAASNRFYVGTSGDGAVQWGEPDATHFKLRTKREFRAEGWYDFSYVVSSTKVGNSVSTVDIVLHPLNGGEDIVVGSNAYPEDGIADGRKVESVTFKDATAKFMNDYCGVYKYNKTVYVPVGDYEIEILPTITADNKYKFYADYIAITPGEEPKPEYPAISLVKETVIEAEDIVETQYGDGTSTWANLQQKVMFYEGEAASNRFYVGTSGDGAVQWGEPDEAHFKLRTKREFLADNWYDFSYVVSSQMMKGSVSEVNIVLHPLDGGEDIVVGSNAYPEDGIADGRKVENVNFTDASANFMNQFCGVYKYNKTAYVPAGNYEIEFLPTITADNKYKFYADYVAISVGEEPKPEYPAISLAKETVIEAESIVETAYGDGTSTWENLQNKIMFYEGSAASGNFFVGTSGDSTCKWGEPDETHFKLRTKREFLADNWYDFSYVVSSQKSKGSVSEVNIVLHSLDGGEDIVVGDNAYPEGGVADGKKVESVTFTNATAKFINDYCGIYKYNKTVYVPAGNYEIEILPLITGDEKYKFYADVITIKVGEEPKTDYPDISLVSETRIEAESMLDTKIGTGESAWANTELQNNIMFWAGDDVSSSFFIGTTGEGKYLYGEPDETHFKARTTREFLQDGWYDFEYVVSAMKTGNVSHVSVVLKPVYGGETIVVGSNPHPNNGNIPQNMVVTPVTITNDSANFLNTHMGAFRYNTTVFVPAGDYVIEIVPGVVESDAQYKFYADYIAISLGEEPVVPEEEDTASVNTSNQTITVVANYKEATSGEFIAVAYKGGQMVGITSFNEIDRVLFEAIVPYECEGTPDTVKVFVLEDFMNIKPVAPAKTIAVK